MNQIVGWKSRCISLSLFFFNLAFVFGINLASGNAIEYDVFKNEQCLQTEILVYFYKKLSFSFHTFATLQKIKTFFNNFFV